VCSFPASGSPAKNVLREDPPLSGREPTRFSAVHHKVFKGGTFQSRRFSRHFFDQTRKPPATYNKRHAAILVTRAADDSLAFFSPVSGLSVGFCIHREIFFITARKGLAPKEVKRP